MSHVTGLQTNAQSLIANLKKLLDDQYDAASIPKELLQNAEDAGATQLHFAFWPALEPSDNQTLHPLLQVPALIVVNNGEFKTSDGNQIASVGLGTKGGQESAIGKFGLGMKSVFNLGEVLFYFASPDQPASIEQAPKNLTNDPPIHEAPAPEEFAEIDTHSKAPSLAHQKLMAREARRLKKPVAALKLTKTSETRVTPTGWCYRRCLNPWHETNQHSDWNEGLPEAMEATLSRLHAFDPCSKERWFALVLPLRTPEMIGTGGALNRLYPTRDDIFRSDVAARLSSFWPMLRSMEEICVWKMDARNQWQRDFFFRRVQSRLREGKHLPTADQSDLAFAFSTQIEHVASQTAKRTAFNVRFPIVGREVLLSSQQIVDADMEARWPQTFAWNDAANDFTYEREKGQPHGAAVWMAIAETAQSQARSTLSISPAVFLPLPESPNSNGGVCGQESVSLSGETSFRLILHGYFFLDGGRKHLILDAPDTAFARVESVWNRRLLEGATLPLVLVALCDFAQNTKFDAQTIRDLSRALFQSQWYRAHSAAFVARSGWMFRLHGGLSNANGAKLSVRKQPKVLAGHEIGQWHLIAPNAPWWTLPGDSDAASSTQSAMLFAWFPQLKALCDERALCWENDPRFMAGTEQIWDVQACLQVVTDIDAKAIFASSAALSCFNDLLEHWRKSNPGLGFESQEAVVLEDVSQWKARLLQIARLALENWKGKQAENAELVDQWKRFFTFLPEECWISFLPRRNEGSQKRREELLAQLLKLQLERLPAPPEMIAEADDAEKHGSWHCDDAARLAFWLAEQRRANLRGQVLFRAIDLLGRTRGDTEEKLAAFGQAEIFDVKSWHFEQDNETVVSWQQLNEWKAERRLWGAALGGALSSGNALLKSWTEASRGEPVWSLNESPRREISNMLWGKDLPRNFDLTAVIILLNRAQPLASAAQRAPLWSKLQQPEDASPAEYRRALRYFLHGQAEHIDNEQTLFYTDAPDTAWRTIGQIALQAEGMHWRLLPPELSRASMGEFSDTLGLERLDAIGTREILETLGEERVRSINLLVLAEEGQNAQRRQILRDCSCSCEVWCALPLHQLQDGTLVSLDDATYLPGDFPPETRLISHIKLLKTPAADLIERYRENGVQKFGAAAVLDLALNQTEPHHFAREILDAVEALDNSGADWPTQWGSLLHEKPWLYPQQDSMVSAECAPFAPRDILHLPFLNHELEALFAARDAAPLPHVEQRLARLQEVAPSLRDHRAWKHHADQWLPDVEQSVKSLSVALQNRIWGREYYLGNLPALDAHLQSRQKLSELVQAWNFSGENKPTGIVLLEALMAQTSSVVLWPVVQALAGKVSAETLSGHLRQLSKGIARDECKSLHREVFALLCRHPDFQIRFLRDTFFPARNGDTQTAQNLCLYGDNIQDGAVLDDEWANHLRRSPVHSSLAPAKQAPPPGQKGTTQSITLKSALQSYSAPLGSSTEVLAALIAICGGVNSEKWCEDFWRKDAYGLVWEQLCGSASQAQRWKQQRENFSTEVLWLNLSSGRIQERNLLGGVCTFGVSQSISTLVAGGIIAPGNSSASGWRLSLRQIDPSKFTKSQLHSVLKTTMETILTAYERYHREKGHGLSDVMTNFDVAFDKWTAGKQADLAIAQKYMLDNAMFYFRTLSGTIKPELKRLIKRYDEWRYTQHELSGLIDSSNTRDSLNKIAAELREQTVLRAQTLALVRDKMTQLGYVADSIPFELLQNADDAVAELHAAYADAWSEDQDRRAGTVCLNINSDTWTWCHRGRGINQYRVGNVSGEMGREAGYARDLEKMLVLQASDKADNTSVGTTGKFGLGFKSVFLATDAPRVVSGDLAFEVLGGFYPQPLEDTQRANILKAVAGTNQTSAPATALQFKSNKAAAEILRRFARLAIFTLGFSRHIKRLEFSQSQPLPSRALEWNETNIASGIGVATLKVLPTAPDQTMPPRALVIRTQSGVLMLGLDNDGPRSLPLDVPAFWVVTPTRSQTCVGWAVGADWNIDVGRAQLSSGEENFRLAQKLGEEIAEKLNILAQQDCSQVAPDCGDFWMRLGAVLAVRGDYLLNTFHQSLYKYLQDELRPYFQNSSSSQLQWEEGVNEEYRFNPNAYVEAHRPSPMAVPSETTAQWLDRVMKQWEQRKDKTEPRFFPRRELVFPDLQSPNKTQKRAAWLRLLVRSCVQGVGRQNDEQHRKFIELCDTEDWIADFSRSDCDASEIGRKLEMYLAHDKEQITYLQWFRRTVPLFALCRWLDQYILTLEQLPRLPKIVDLNFLNPRQSIYGDLDAPNLQNVLGIGAHFLLRELARPANASLLINEARVHPLCFYPGQTLRSALSHIEPSIQNLDGVAASKKVWQIMQQHRPLDPTLGGDFDLPLVYSMRQGN